MPSRTNELLREAEALSANGSSISRAERKFDGPDEAAAYFEGLKARLGDLTNWNLNSGLSTYELFDENGKPSADTLLKRGRFVRIKLRATGKSDWVRIEEILESTDEMVVTVRPTFDPTGDPPDRSSVAHFFSAKATNNFCVRTDDRFVRMYVIGLNENTNTDDAEGMVEAARNAAIANLGYYLGIQKAEWTKFCESFLSDDGQGQAK